MQLLQRSAWQIVDHSPAAAGTERDRSAKRTSAVGGSERLDGKSFRCWRRRPNVYRRRGKRVRFENADALRRQRQHVPHRRSRRFWRRRGGAGKGKDRRAEIARASLTAANGELRSTIWWPNSTDRNFLVAPILQSNVRRTLMRKRSRFIAIPSHSR